MQSGYAPQYGGAPPGRYYIESSDVEDNLWDYSFESQPQSRPSSNRSIPRDMVPHLDLSKTAKNRTLRNSTQAQRQQAAMPVHRGIRVSTPPRGATVHTKEPGMMSWLCGQEGTSHADRNLEEVLPIVNSYSVLGSQNITPSTRYSVHSVHNNKPVDTRSCHPGRSCTDVSSALCDEPEMLYVRREDTEKLQAQMAMQQPGGHKPLHSNMFGPPPPKQRWQCS